MNALKKILVVDDEEDVLIYFTTLFEDNGFETISALNGNKALELAKFEKPDLITLDITMPEQSGIKTYHCLKNEADLRDIPVVIITAMGESINNIMGELNGLPPPEGFMSKPIDQKKLIEMASNLTAK